MSDPRSAAPGEPLHPAPAWASSAGVLDPLAQSGLGSPLDVVHRYCWSYDERRAEALRDCFAEDGVWEGLVMGEIPIGPFAGGATILEWLTRFWPHQHDQRRHMIVNPLVVEDGPGEATVLAYLLLMSARDSAAKLETTGFYRVRVRHEEDRWRIVHLFGGFDAPFWPGKLEQLSERGRRRHGIREREAAGSDASAEAAGAMRR